MQVFGFPGTLPHELNESPPQPAAEAAHTAIEDRSEARFRVESIDIGIRLTLLMCAAGVLYALYTWDDRSGRQLIVSLLGISAAVALTVYLLPIANEKLAPIFEKQLKKGARIVSHNSEFSGWTAVKVENIENDGEGHSHKLYLYSK